MRYLRTNTAIRLTVGPFFDNTDGVTPETAITVTNEKLTFVVDDANVPTLVLDTAPTASGGANDMVHITGDDAGFYDLELAAANVNYLGRAMLSLTNASVHCPVFHEFMILPAMVYDSLVLGTDRFDVNVTHVADTSQTAGDIIADTNDIQSRLPAALSGDGFIKADMKSIDDELTSGNNASLNLKNISVVPSSGDAIYAYSPDGDALSLNAQSAFGTAIRADGGITGIFASAVEGEAVKLQSSDGHALSLISVTGGKSINAPANIAVSDGDLTLAAIASAVWAAATRTLTAISDSSGITTLLSRIGGALNISGGKVESNVKQINGTNVTGDGSGTPWGPA